MRRVLLVDERPPLSLTSDKSTECYRNWWPGPGDAMVALMNRSIDLLESLAEESGNLFHLNRRGYLYVTADIDSLPAFQRAALEPPKLGAGDLRIHRGLRGDPSYQPSPAEGYAGQPDGADLILDRDLLHAHFPYLAEEAIAGLHVRRAGWFSAQQLGAYLLEQARSAGANLAQARLCGVEVNQEKVTAVRLQDGARIKTGCFINAAGPYIREVSAMLGVDLPVFNELHQKVSFKDPLRVVPREAPLLIWNDPQHLPWEAEERALLEEEPASRWLLEAMPAGVHTRPEGGPDSPIILGLWEYADVHMQPVWPPPLDPDYPEIALRGLATMIPGLRTYIGRLARPFLDGGYYTKTRENRPLIGPLPVRGAFVSGAYSGYGLMAACAAGELLAAHVTGGNPPHYAQAFSLERYGDERYQRLLESWVDSGQL